MRKLLLGIWYAAQIAAVSWIAGLGAADGVVMAIDPFTALLLSGLVSGGVSAGIGGAQIAAGNDARDDLLDSGNFFAVDPRDITSFGPFAQLLQELQAGIGRVSLAGESASPFDTARSQIEALPGLSEKQKRRAAVGLDTLERKNREHKDPIVANALRTALARTDFAGVDDLLAANVAFQEDQDRFNTAFNRDTLDTILKGRVDNQLGIANLLSDFPSASGSAIDDFTATVREEMLGRAQRDALELADTARVNPAGLLGEVNRTVESDSLARALTLLGGKQQLAGQELGTRFAASAGAQNPLAAASSIAANSFANAGSVAASQATSRNQQITQGIQSGLAGQNAGFQTLNQGAGDLTSLLILNSILNKPGATGAPPAIPSPFTT